MQDGIDLGHFATDDSDEVDQKEQFEGGEEECSSDTSSKVRSL